jgi:hypothetical protein
MWRHLAATVGTSKTRGGEQGLTISLKAALQAGHWLRALIYNNKNHNKNHYSLHSNPEE